MFALLIDFYRFKLCGKTYRMIDDSIINHTTRIESYKIRMILKWIAFTWMRFASFSLQTNKAKVAYPNSNMNSFYPTISKYASRKISFIDAISSGGINTF